MGGMAAFIPVKGDAEKNDAAFAKVRADKEREARNGHDGTWVAHPGLVPLALEVFTAVLGDRDNQIDVMRDDVTASRAALLRPIDGAPTDHGLRHNLRVGVTYLAAWLDGNGCVPIDNLMEDAATAEIARAQLWQWLHFNRDGGEPLHLHDGTPVDFGLLDRALIGLPSRFADRDAIPGGACLDEAIRLLHDLTHQDELVDFLTLPAYERLP